MGNRDRRKHIAWRGDIVSNGTAAPTQIFTNRQPRAPTIMAKAFDTRQRGLIEGSLEPGAVC
jgi:hypothetical protein